MSTSSRTTASPCGSRPAASAGRSTSPAGRSGTGGPIARLRNSPLREDETRGPIGPIVSDEAQPRPLEDSSILVGPVDADERRQETRRGGEEDHATSRSKEARRDSSAVVRIRQVVEGTREDDCIERSDLEGRTREVGPEQIAT